MSTMKTEEINTVSIHNLAETERRCLRSRKRKRRPNEEGEYKRQQKALNIAQVSADPLIQGGSCRLFHDVQIGQRLWMRIIVSLTAGEYCRPTALNVTRAGHDWVGKYPKQLSEVDRIFCRR